MTESRAALSTSVVLLKEETDKQLAGFSRFRDLLYISDKRAETKAFLASRPSLHDFRDKMVYYKDLEEKILLLPNAVEVKCLNLVTEQAKKRLAEEAKRWYVEYGTVCKDEYNAKAKSIVRTVRDLIGRMSRSVDDTDDAEEVLEALARARDLRIDIELDIGPIEECYGLMNQFGMAVKRDEMERVDVLRYWWTNLNDCVTRTENGLETLQSQFALRVEESLTQFLLDCDDFCLEYRENGPATPGLKPKEALDRLRRYQVCIRFWPADPFTGSKGKTFLPQDHFDYLWNKRCWLSRGRLLLGLPFPEVPELARVGERLKLLWKLYVLYNDVVEAMAGYREIPWSELEVDRLISELLEFQSRCRKLPKTLREWPAFSDLKNMVDELDELCPLIELMTNGAMKDRHWKKLEEITKHAFPVNDAGFRLKSVLEIPLLNFKEEIEDVCVSAQKERDVESKLRSVVDEWQNRRLEFSSFKNRGELVLRGDAAAEIVSILEDSLTAINSLFTNRYNGPFRSDIQRWMRLLSTANEVMERWLLVQNLWIYLEAVFVGGDIAQQLPKEAERFSAADRSWVKMMDRARLCPDVINCCSGDDMPKRLLPHLQEQLELCQKSLTGYLEKKRLRFPRFFFVSDPVLLEILGRAGDSHSVEPHLLSLFDNTRHLIFDQACYDLVTDVVSSEGESFRLDQPVLAAGNVEEWLTKLLLTSRRSLHGIIKKAADSVFGGGVKIMDFLRMNLAQVALLGLQLVWTREAEISLSNAGKNRKIMKDTNQLFLKLLNALIGYTTKNLSGVERTKYENLIVIHVHQRDIFDRLCASKIDSPYDFEWQRQCRFYFRAHVDKTVISVTDVDFVYQNEFLGCTERLVVTPLTDRCYITLAQALNLNMGGCPTGPAGTGKTETTKDMGKTLGKYVVVFNCSDQMDYRGLGRIFKGLAQSGSWGCFDEFNRIELPVLSVAAQQIAIILTCKKERMSEFVFSDGDVVSMNPEFGIFITMNPDYAGRQQLPENLKIQFRSVAMMVPDRQIIIRVKLASCGFLENVALARKFHCLYNICEEQLTKQIHYDFGLRNILSVLRTLGVVKRQNPQDPESSIVMRVLKNMNLSKLVDEDEPLFLSLIEDLFPAVERDNKGYSQLDSRIKEEIEAAGLADHTPWTAKIIQLYETSEVRHGIMILGPAGAGKTSCIRILAKALGTTDRWVREVRLNPKAMTAAQMFGRLDVATNDWTDGIFSALWRKTSKAKKGELTLSFSLTFRICSSSVDTPPNFRESKNQFVYLTGERTWLVLDGPIDPVWIENLNSVLDDNRTLTLANGDRIPMVETCKVLFEVDCVDNASPATVSRNGMVYVSSSGLSWKPILTAWLNKRSKIESDVIGKYFYDTFEHIYIWTSRNLSFKTTITEYNVITQAITLLEGMLMQEYKSERIETTWNKLYIFSLMWSVGAVMEADHRRQLELYVRSNFSSFLHLPPEDGSSMFDYWIDESGKWQHWESRMDSVTDELHWLDYDTFLVPCVDSVRTDYLTDVAIEGGRRAMLMGAAGTAKTTAVRAYLQKRRTERRREEIFAFSFATTPEKFQKRMESLLEKRTGNTLGPGGGKTLTVFVDDIHTPGQDDWGHQAANEILRQTIESGGFYSLDRPGDFFRLVDVGFLAASRSCGVTPRLLRHFLLFDGAQPTDDLLDRVFGAVAHSHFNSGNGFSSEVRQLAERLVPLTRALWLEMKARIAPVPGHFFRLLEPRDLSRVWKGMSEARSRVVTEGGVLLRLWTHECRRVLVDGWTGPEEDYDFSDALRRVSEALPETLLRDLPEDTYFAHFLGETAEGCWEDRTETETSGLYEPVRCFRTLEERLKTALSAYNDSVRGTGMDLVFFQRSVVDLLKISRIIRMPGENALLVGVGGSGKQSLTKLACFLADYQIFRIVPTGNYGPGNFLEDMKNLFKSTGIHDRRTTFLFSERDSKDESFVEYLNDILSTGTIPNLFNREEKSEIVQEVSSSLKRDQLRNPASSDTVFEHFLSRARKNLHVVLRFSPAGEKLRRYASRYPKIISACSVVGFRPWPHSALKVVALERLDGFDPPLSEDARPRLAEVLGGIHRVTESLCARYLERSGRTVHVTPRSFLSFLSDYRRLYRLKRGEVDSAADRTRRGVAKLEEASVSTEELKRNLARTEEELQVTTRESLEVLSRVTERTRAAEEVKEEARRMREELKSLVDGIGIDKAIAEEKLEEAGPALREAEAALDTVRPTHIATVRKLSHPPHLVMRIMDCVLILFHRKLNPVTIDSEHHCVVPSWEESLKFMSSTSFLQSLQNFDKDSIDDETVELLAPYFQKKDYNMNTARRVCGDVAGLLSWTKAMVFFYGINKEVIPLKANVQIQEERLQVATEELNRVEADLQEKEKKLNEVRAQYEAALAEKRRLADRAEDCRRKASTASVLLSELAGEFERWSLQSEQFRDRINRVAGDSLLATAFLSYSGPFDRIFRCRLMDEWRQELRSSGVPFSLDLDVVRTLVDDSLIARWNSYGLPGDEKSIENGIIVFACGRYPLLVDPQNRGRRWIQKKEEPNGLRVTSFRHKLFRRRLEESLSAGRPLLIEDVGEELDPVLDDIIDKNFVKTGTMSKVMVGDRECDVTEGFRLYLATGLTDPVYDPETYARTCLVDFAVTPEGLEDQLLCRIILTEKAALEEERRRVMEETADNAVKIRKLEDDLLGRLASVKGSLLDDDCLIGVLRDARKTSRRVSENLAAAEDTRKKIDRAREEFRPAAARGSLLYFLSEEMGRILSAYRMSLDRFLRLFDLSLLRSEKDASTPQRVANVVRCLTLQVYRFSVRSYFERHKFRYSFLLALKVASTRAEISPEELVLFVRGGETSDAYSLPVQLGDWIPGNCRSHLARLTRLPGFEDLTFQIGREEEAWRRWWRKEKPEEEETPDDRLRKRSDFQKLLLVRCLRPDRTPDRARIFVSDVLGKEYVEGVALNLESTWAESDPATLLLCLLSTGTDPTSQIEELAKKLKLECRQLSMGQGQEAHARRLLRDCVLEGRWLLLQNCHLNIPFSEEISNILEEIGIPHTRFRLWMTTEVHPQFPLNILQASIKFTNEPPGGIKACMKRLLANLPDDTIKDGEIPSWNRIVFAAAFFHASLLERRKFGPSGWNVPYEFDRADFVASVQFLQKQLEDSDPQQEICWRSVAYVVGQVHYGGRITDDFDRRLLITYTEEWFRPWLLRPDTLFRPGYPLPSDGCQEEMQRTLEALPDVDSPDVFGLDANVDVAYRTREARALFDAVGGIRLPNYRAGQEESREEEIRRRAEEILNRLSLDYPPETAPDFSVDRLSPTRLFLRREVDRMTLLLRIVRTDLRRIGSSVPEDLRSLFDHRTPVSWKTISWETDTLGSWLVELEERDRQYRNWLTGKKPKVFWFPGFFHPRGLLISIRQETCRSHPGWALDAAIQRNEITRMDPEEVTEAATDGAYICGLFLEGARWDRETHRLADSLAGVLFSPLPVVRVFATEGEERDEDPGLYECPVYLHPERTRSSLVGTLDLTSDRRTSRWILRGVASLCRTNQ
ncbi:LOW QUALITY PROTEIN: dynein axonemal heavy chain 5-like [Centruroides vittatus]|uniref:LOW QUALITY PROTEIN: dynein axonemal heavy chain 5-like n=1 Tax=Centruroides vittatus TaxID=120091 RepID=UPI00350FA365